VERSIEISEDIEGNPVAKIETVEKEV